MSSAHSSVHARLPSERRLRSVALVATLPLAAALLAATAAAAQQIPEGLHRAIDFRHIGPIGNRVPAVVGEPGNPLVYYLGAASGGIFRTRDGGVRWEPVFDDMEVASIGALALAPSDPNVLYAGTGETNIRSNVSVGNGVYRSTDRGDHWHYLGLPKSGRIGRIVVHPEDPDTVWVAAMGHGYGPQPERGVYRSADGGATWQQTLFVDEDTGAIDIAIDPSNPRRLYAAMWQFEMKTWGRTSGGPGSGIFRSSDGGRSWERLEGNGLPRPPWGKIGLAISAARPQRVYALIETSSNADFAPSDPFQGVLWRSENGGDSWSLISRDNTLTQRPLYYTRAVAAPDDADEITFLATLQTESIDGGSTITVNNSGWDHHDQWIDPLQPERRITGHDGGVSISLDRGKSWFRPQLPIAQAYHVGTDDAIPYFVYGNRQDGPSFRGPSRALTGPEIPTSAFHSVGGCEVGFAVPHRADPNLIWSGCYDGRMDLYDLRTGHSRDVSVWPIDIESWAAADLELRFQWNVPIATSFHDAERVYVGSQFVHETTDRGRSWQIISPDLTTADPELMKRSGGLTLDDAGPTIAPVVFAIAESRIEPGVLWAGTNDGKLHVRRGSDAEWTDLTTNLTLVPPLGTITNVEPSRHVAGKAYITIDRHQLGDGKPYVLVTNDHGTTWTALSDDLPGDPLGSSYCVREDPEVPGLLYLGTASALWTSLDDGGSWIKLSKSPTGRTLLPPAPIHWIDVQERFGDLVIATYGRGVWILDDLTPLRTAARASSSDTLLLPPRDAYRFRPQGAPMVPPDIPATGTNPAPGTPLHYSLAEPAASVRIEIRDTQGALVTTLDDLSQSAGLHRVHWDLRGERSREIVLRTAPDEAPHVALDSTGERRFTERGRAQLLAPPGDYEIRLVADGEEYSQTLRLRPDPGSSAEEVREQAKLLNDLWRSTDEAAEWINRAESVREQLLDEIDRLEGTEPDLAQDLRALERRIADAEARLFDLRLTGARQDTLRWQRRLYARLVDLVGRIQKGDAVPNSQHHEVARTLQAQLEEVAEELGSLLDLEIRALNERLGPLTIDSGSD